MRRRAATVASAIAIAMCLASTAGADTDSLPGEPEGEHIVVTVGAGSPGNVPMLMLTPGAPVRFITEALTQDRPAWSPDCRSLVFSRSGPGMELFVAEVGGPARQLTFGHHYGAGSPAWSPDGGTIVFTSYGQAPILALPDPHTELFSIRPD
ncbi:MAG: hypothetical protein QOC92_2608, partial [Acidimicrobiaceae bacterium]